VHAQELQDNFRRTQIDRGGTLYLSNCAECHSDGTGVPGVNFQTGEFPQGSTDDDLVNAIHNGISGTTMPAHNFTGAELTALVAYVRSLTAKDAEPVKLGDAGSGKELFENEGKCLDCHRVGGKGSRVALNLSDVGLVRQPSFLLRSLIDPNAVLAMTPQSRLIRATTNTGKVIHGRRLNEDTYTIQIMDDHENLVSLDKANLRSVEIVKESPMPSLKGKFSDEQISDLVAYLASLKVASMKPPTVTTGAGLAGAAVPSLPMTAPAPTPANGAVK
jgi:cytochrome c oxidase cbb3-type subunit 3